MAASKSERRKMKSVMVNYFPSGSTMRVELEVSDDLTFGKIRSIVGKFLKLKPESIQIFGLFLGQTDNTMKLCHNEETATLLKEESVLQFQRLSFNEELERIVTSVDEQAMELIFWEAKEQYERNLIFPPLKLENNDWIEHLVMFLGKNSSSNRKRFVQFIYSLTLYYWSYYYRATGIVQDELIFGGKVCLERGQAVNVVMNAAKLIFVDCSGERELAFWQWCCVRCVKMMKTPKPVVKFEVLEVGSSDPVPLRVITVETEQIEYLFTLSTHVLNINEKEYLKKHGKFPCGPPIALAELVTKHKFKLYLNRCFYDPIASMKKRSHEKSVTPVASSSTAQTQKYEKLKYKKLSQVYF